MCARCSIKTDGRGNRKFGSDQDENDDGEEKKDQVSSDTNLLKELCEVFIAQCDLVMDNMEDKILEIQQDWLDMEVMLQNETNVGFVEGYEEE